MLKPGPFSFWDPWLFLSRDIYLLYLSKCTCILHSYFSYLCSQNSGVTTQRKSSLSLNHQLLTCTFALCSHAERCRSLIVYASSNKYADYFMLIHSRSKLIVSIEIIGSSTIVCRSMCCIDVRSLESGALCPFISYNLRMRLRVASAETVRLDAS